MENLFSYGNYEKNSQDIINGWKNILNWVFSGGIIRFGSRASYTRFKIRPLEKLSFKLCLIDKFLSTKVLYVRISMHLQKKKTVHLLPLHYHYERMFVCSMHINLIVSLTLFNPIHRQRQRRQNNKTHNNNNYMTIFFLFWGVRCKLRRAQCNERLKYWINGMPFIKISGVDKRVKGVVEMFAFILILLLYVVITVMWCLLGDFLWNN